MNAWWTIVGLLMICESTWRILLLWHEWRMYWWKNALRQIEDHGKTWRYHRTQVRFLRIMAPVTQFIVGCIFVSGVLAQ